MSIDQETPESQVEVEADIEMKPSMKSLHTLK